MASNPHAALRPATLARSCRRARGTCDYAALRGHAPLPQTVTLPAPCGRAAILQPGTAGQHLSARRPAGVIRPSASSRSAMERLRSDVVPRVRLGVNLCRYDVLSWPRRVLSLSRTRCRPPKRRESSPRVCAGGLLQLHPDSGMGRVMQFQPGPQLPHRGEGDDLEFLRHGVNATNYDGHPSPDRRCEAAVAPISRSTTMVRILVTGGRGRSRGITLHSVCGAVGVWVAGSVGRDPLERGSRLCRSELSLLAVMMER
jgi:hypothetical protein